MVIARLSGYSMPELAAMETGELVYCAHTTMRAVQEFPGVFGLSKPE